MTDTEKQEKPSEKRTATARLPQTMTPQQASALALHEEEVANREAGINFGTETIPGGKFVGEDGQLHNAHGEPIDEDGTVLDEADADRGESRAAERAKALEDDGDSAPSGAARKSGRSGRKRS